ncbi:MAG TPA: hypothetical protein VGS20_08160 [Candidatus Acidoferrales bacterium]|nr:hypothetical protein [Candidatus Acidoferrales bacterium]
MEPLPADTEYQVEVSGWDSSETFFVERTTLELGEEGDRFVHLRHPLRPGLMVFLRLIDSRAGSPSLPIAYQVKEVTSAGAEGVNRASLLRLHHRRAGDEKPLGPGDTADLP